jgi:hypothetical protein
MRFVVTGEWSRNRLLHAVVLCFLVFTTLFWLSNFFMFLSKMSLTPSSVTGYYLGNEELFQQPRSFRGMIEVAHYHLFAMGMLLMTLTHLMLFVPLQPSFKFWLIVLPFGGALMDEAGGWLTRFVYPGFAWMKIGGFVLLQVTLLVLILTCFWSIFGGSNGAYTGMEEDADEDDL